MKTPKRTQSISAFAAFKHLFEDPNGKDEPEVNEEANTIPDLEAFDTTRISHEKDLELDTLNESMESMQPPKTTTTLRFIQNSTDSVLDSLIEEAKKEEVPKHCTSTYLASMGDGELSQVEVEDEELSRFFRMEQEEETQEH